MPEPIRLLDTHRRPGGPGPWILAAVAVALAAVLVVLLASSESGPEPTASVPATLAAPTSTAPAPTTTIAPQSLGQLVPRFQGRVRATGIGPELEPTAWTWSTGDSEPRQVLLPGISVRDGAWDASLNLFAAISESMGPTLYSGTPSQFQVVADRVLSFAWHLSEPGSIAYTTSLPDGTTNLWTSPGPPFSSFLVAAFAFDARLVAFGDWGFALSDSSTQIDRELLITLDPEGQLIASAALTMLDASANGQLLVQSSINDEQSLAVLDITLAPGDQLDLPPVIGVLFSPNGTWVAVTTDEDGDVILHLRHLVGSGSDSFALRLGPINARPVSWSNDRQWLLLEGLETTNFENQLIFADLLNGTIFTAPVGNDVSSFVIDSIAGSGPPVLQDA